MNSKISSAEFQTLRELCGYSREELADLMSIEVRTVRAWERPNGRPVDGAIDTLQATARRVCDLAERLLATNPTALPRLRDLSAKSPYAEGFDACTWGAAVTQCVARRPDLKVTWLMPELYAEWLRAKGKEHDLASLNAWAAESVGLSS